MHIYLVRHTEYSNPENVYVFHQPFELTEGGRQHAQRVARWFVDRKILSIPIYSSPLLRCQQTAQILSTALSSSIQTDPRLIDSYCPDLQGKPQGANDPWKVEEDDPSREPKAVVEERAVAVLDEKIKAGKDCILVSHGDPLTILYYHVLKQERPHYFWDPAHKDSSIFKGEIVDIEIVEGQDALVHRYRV
jgi:broad specificity phosphatase PhoE